MVLGRGRRWLPRILSNRAEARSIFDELSRRLLQRPATKPTLRFGTTMSHSIDEIERLVSAEIKMRKVSERSVLGGRMKSKMQCLPRLSLTTVLLPGANPFTRLFAAGLPTAVA